MILILMKGKLNHTDIILPILAGLRKNNFKKKIKLVYPSKGSLEIIKENTSLYKTLKSISQINHFYMTEELQKYYLPYLIAGIISVLHRNLILIKLLFTKTYVLNIEIPPKINWLINLNRKLYKGQKVSLFLYTFDINQLHATFKRTQQLKGVEHNEFLNKLDTDSDLLISSFTSNELKTIYSNIDKHNYAQCYIGHNLYNWPSWKKLIINNSQDAISKLPNDYIFFPLAILSRKNGNKLRDYRGSINKILEAIREEDKKTYIIFRPHPTTDIRELDILFKNMNLENYIISYTNPIVLIKYCKFVVRYGTSLLDSRVFDQGKYLIRYFYPELAMDMKEELNYNKDLGHKNNFIDITDEETLTSTIKATLKDSKYRAVSNNLVNDEKDSINRIIKYFNSKKKFIYVFLNNKIISCDTILPIMLEVKTNNKNIDIIFWSFDFNTYEFIKKNELLYKAIKEIGSLVCLGRKKNSLYFSNKGVSKYSYKRLNIIINCLKNLNNFISLFKNILINKVIFIHFRALNLWPTRLIYYLNKKNTILCDADSSGWSLSGYKADKSVHEQRPDPYAFKNLSPRGKKVIAFSKDWPLLKHPAIINAKKYIIESSHKRKVWIDYLKNNASSMIKQSTGLNQQQKFCVLLLGHIGEEASGAKFLKNKDSWTTLVEDILDIIYDEWPEITILVKPHIITDMQCLEKIIAARKHIKIKITYLHPGLLAIFSKFSVATYYSTIFQSISCLGGITVEYTDQKLEYLKKLSFKSKRPEFTNYFFNNDENGFRDFLIKFKLGSIKVNLSEGSTEDPSNIINFLSN